MQLHNLKTTKKNRKRIGRGNASCGTYSGKGMKGQTSRAGGKRRPGFEGGQTPLIRRMPKLRGFRSPNKVTYQVVNIAKLQETFKTGDKISKVELKNAKLIFDDKKPVKLLGSGEIKIALEISVDLASKTAIEKIEKAKGTITILKAPKVEKLSKEVKKEIRKKARK